MKKTSTIFTLLTLMLFFTGAVSAQPLFTDNFESGTASLEWEVYSPQTACNDIGEICENVEAVTMATAPDPLATGGSYIGWLQDLDNSNTGAALSIAGMTTDQDYSIEADVWCYVNHPDGSAYTGVAFYADSNFHTYIKLVADFDASQRLRLYNNIFDPVTFQYTFEHSFTASDIPGGIPTVDGWHKMKVEIKTLNADTTAFWCYFDDQELLGCPIYDTTDYRMSSGKYGVFSFSPGSGSGIPGYFDNVVVNPEPTSVEDNSNGLIPSEIALEQNYPNPFNPETQISYHLANGGFISLTVHDLLGRDIKTLVSEDQPSGSYTVSWDGKDELGYKVPSGIYLYSLKTGSFVESKKMILMK
jgi:hypothetical protein